MGGGGGARAPPRRLCAHVSRRRGGEARRSARPRASALPGGGRPSRRAEPGMREWSKRDAEGRDRAQPRARLLSRLRRTGANKKGGSEDRDRGRRRATQEGREGKWGGRGALASLVMLGLQRGRKAATALTCESPISPVHKRKLLAASHASPYVAVLVGGTHRRPPFRRALGNQKCKHQEP